jgi:glycosyltransferase involved in cell wall biosynthesis
MSLGTPVLASNAAALVEVTADAALQPDPTNQRELVQSIALLDGDEALRARLIAAGQRRARDFSWDACASATLAVYREAIAAGTAG